MDFQPYKMTNQNFAIFEEVVNDFGRSDNDSI